MTTKSISGTTITSGYVLSAIYNGIYIDGVSKIEGVSLPQVSGGGATALATTTAAANTSALARPTG